MYRLEENMKSADVILSTEELENLNNEVSKIEVVEERYPAALAARVGI